MKGKVTSLCDLQSIQIPAEMLNAVVDERQVEQELKNLSMRYAAQVSSETVEAGNVVYCRGDRASYPDGRDLILYTALQIPGTEDAVSAVLGKRVGDVCETLLCGKKVCLTVEKIIRLIPADVNDELIRSLNVENVTTVQAYRDYTAAKKTAELQMEKSKMAIGYVMEQMVAGSTFAYDPAEFEQYLADERENLLADCCEDGIETPSEEEIREGVLYQFKQGWMAEEFCRRNQIQIDREAAEAEAERLMEMMTLMGERVPEREQMIEETLRNAYSIEMFQRIGDLVAEKMGGNPHGNS